jgi:CRISPR-associated endonuclease Csn1
MKKILGLDIGTTSIGWAVVEVKDEKTTNEKTGETVETCINNDRKGMYSDAVGVRILAQDTERFDKGLTLNDPKGSTLTPTATRRKYRGARRMKSRYKLRRDKLKKVIAALGIETDEKYYTNEKKIDAEGKRIKRGENNDIGKAIYELRDKALRQQITLNELGRVLLHLNQWRGYSSDRFKKDEKEANKKGDNELFTSIVENVKLIGELPNDKRYHYFMISFENGDKGCDIRKVEEKESNFLLGEMHTYYFDEKNKEPEIDGIKKIKFTKLDTESFAHRKKQINNKIELFIAGEEAKDKTLGTVGSFFYHHFYKSANTDEKLVSRIRNHTIDRDWYENELEKIFLKQYEFNKIFFEAVNIENLVKTAFNEYAPILNDISKREGKANQILSLIKDKIIFFQRPWQQAKNKGQCPFEKILVKKERVVKGTGKKESYEEYIGRTVIPRSHPLFQEFKLWQQINNVRLFYNDENGKHDLFDSNEGFESHTGKSIAVVKKMLYTNLCNSKTLSWRSFIKGELGIEVFEDLEEKKQKKRSSKEGVNTNTGEVADSYYSVNFRKRKRDGSYEDIKLKGNTTAASLLNILEGQTFEWLQENHKKVKGITNGQLLWEIIYDITNGNAGKVAEIIKKHFGFDNKFCQQLASLKFDDVGMGNLSAKAIRQILPLMIDGKDLTRKATDKIKSLRDINNTDKDKDEKLESLKEFLPDKKARLKLSKYYDTEHFKYLNYWEATAVVYGSHSSNNIKPKGIIEKVKPHSMNNPVVEKIVNETIGLVNEIYYKYGFDEVRIELSRELKASMEERQQMWEGMMEGARKNEWAKQMLRELKGDNLDTEASNKSNVDKIKIIEDVVRFTKADEYKVKSKEYKLNEPTKAEVKKYLHWLEQNFRCPYTNQPIPFTDIFSRIKRVEIEHIIPRERYYLNSYANKVITWKEVNEAKADNGNRTAYEFIVSRRTNDRITLYDGRELNLVVKEEWESHVKGMFPKGGKQANLLRKTIPEDPIERTLRETQYINKKLKEKLSELVGSTKVWVTSGAVTDILRDKWHLNEKIFKELVRERFENYNIGEKKDKPNLVYWTKQFNPKTNKEEEVEMFAGYSKRIDHRHHAMDAIVVACTKQHHIQYINTLNTINSVDVENDPDKKAKYKLLKEDICIGNSSKKFKTPWEETSFIPDVKNALSNIIVSHKNSRLVISPSKHRVNKKINSSKLASIRGQLHKDTNYASRKYFEGGRTEIKKLIPKILISKKDNQLQTMVHFKKFEEIIREIVLKKKYQDILITLFSPYEDKILTPQLCKELSKEILKKIDDENLLCDSDTGIPYTWLSTYEEKDKSNRPNGHLMNLNDPKEINAITNPRLKRIANYRLDFVNMQKKAIDELDIDKKEKDKKKREAESLPLYSNAIYELRIGNKDGSATWKEIKDVTIQDIEHISYLKPETTKLIKAKILEKGLDRLKAEYLTNPVFISDMSIEVKKARQKSYYQSLYEVSPKRYVQVEETFMTYFFKEKGESNFTNKRQVKFLKFIDAVSIISHEKPDKIDYNKLIEKERTNEELQSGKSFELLFTLAKNDLVYLPEKELSQEEAEAINWDNKSSIAKNLYIVKDMNPSLNKIVFQQFYKSDSIKINETDAKNLFNNPELKELSEEIKYGTVPMLQKCIKVFTDKLGQKVIPFWNH